MARAAAPPQHPLALVLFGGPASRSSSVRVGWSDQSLKPLAPTGERGREEEEVGRKKKGEGGGMLED